MAAAKLLILTEEASGKAALDILVPKIRGAGKSPHHVIVHRCKSDLLEQLPGLMKGYARSLDPSVHIVVLVDSDRADCRALKKHLEEIAMKCGLTATSTRGAPRRVFVRIVEKELEAWYFGDWEAVRAAYPRVSPHIPNQARYRNPDAIANAWEAFERILKRHGYFKSGLRKIEAARNICPHMDPDRNVSKSFQVFRDTLRRLP